MAIDLNALRVHVHRELADHDRAVSASSVAVQFACTRDEAQAALAGLHDAYLIVLDNDRHCLLMAHPWATAFMGFVVASEHRKWWGGCAWDSFAIPSLVGARCLVTTHCPGCGSPLRWTSTPRHRRRRTGRATSLPTSWSRPSHLGRRRSYMLEPAPVLQQRARGRLAGSVGQNQGRGA